MDSKYLDCSSHGRWTLAYLMEFSLNEVPNQDYPISFDNWEAQEISQIQISKNKKTSMSHNLLYLGILFLLVEMAFKDIVKSSLCRKTEFKRAI